MIKNNITLIRPEYRQLTDKDINKNKLQKYTLTSISQSQHITAIHIITHYSASKQNTQTRVRLNLGRHI